MSYRSRITSALPEWSTRADARAAQLDDEDYTLSRFRRPEGPIVPIHQLNPYPTMADLEKRVKEVHDQGGNPEIDDLWITDAIELQWRASEKKRDKVSMHRWMRHLVGRASSIEARAVEPDTVCGFRIV